MVNFGPLAAEIGSGVWGTTANFNGFHVLAALLHGTLYWASAKLCGVEQRVPPIFGMAVITLGIGPHSNRPIIVVMHGVRISHYYSNKIITGQNFNINVKTCKTVTLQWTFYRFTWICLLLLK